MKPWNASLVILALIGLSTSAFAQSKKSTAPAKQEAQQEESDKVDISDLEKKYWAPKDTDFSVVQNRTYAKENSIFVTAHAGPLVNDQYSEGYIYGGSLNYFFNERYGLQATYLTGDLKNNNATNDLTKFGSGVQPDFGRFKNYYGIGFNFVPFYAKMSFIGKKILYFDMAITPHIGMTEYDQIMEGQTRGKSALTYGIDISQFFFLTENFAIRADLKNQFFTEEVVSYRGNASATPPVAKGEKVRDQTTQFTTFMLGLTLYFK